MQSVSGNAIGWRLLFAGLLLLCPVALMAAGARAYGGPDAAGYSYFDQRDGCSHDYVDISATGTLLVQGDDQEGRAILGGPGLDFYGLRLTALTASTNGILASAAGVGADASNDCPIPATPSAGAGDRLLVLHDDLSSRVYHQYFPDSCPRPNDAGLASSGCNIFQWQGGYVSGVGNVDFQAILYDWIDEIVYQYAVVDQSGSASTTGMQNAAADTGLPYACNIQDSVTPETAVCIFRSPPPPACDTDVVWIDDQLFTPLSRFSCRASRSISTGSMGVFIARNAQVGLSAPRINLSGPFRVAAGGILRISSTLPPPCTDPADRDNDRLPDCVETNTGVFVDAGNTGTDPMNPDTDGDGIDDGDEVLGTRANLDLPAMGLDPLRRNILLEYDWFDDNRDPGTCAAHSHRPSVAAITAIEQAFAAAPVVNPDGTTGITLIQDYGQGGVYLGGNLVEDGDGVIAGGVNDSDFLAYKQANFAANRNGYFHYVLLPHRYNTGSASSGQAELVGDDLIVSLYCYGSDTNVAHTLVHELGHNLGLRHGGFESLNWKPNYNSVMNYKYQFPGVDSCDDADQSGDGILDFAIGDRIDLDETDLDETLGSCGNMPWDWNEDGSIETGVVADINCNNGGKCDGQLGILRDHDDWGRLDFSGLRDADGLPVGRTSSEIIRCDNPPPAG